ncbi:acyl-CoA N-acyltransferase [Umbelopsis sp. PMI_123]|nr:acyl-CoA N-acyltransferase [Umbelopsis sp. PMI_123]
MPTQVAKDTVHFTLRDGSRIIARTSERTDREIVRQFRIECGWDEDKVDDWFDMVDEGLRLQYMAIGEDGAPVGMIALDLEDMHYKDVEVASRTTKTGCVASLYISKSKRKGGAALALIEYLEVQAKAEGIECITMNTLPHNATSLHIFEGLGYKKFKEALRYKDPAHEELLAAVFLRKRL